MVAYNIPKKWFYLLKVDQLCAIVPMSKTFTQNGGYGNQPQLFEVVFYNIDGNTACSLTKQDLTVNQAYHVSFCFVLCDESKFWQSTLLFSAFYRLFLEITSFYTTPSGQIIPCHLKNFPFFLFDTSCRDLIGL